MSVERTHSTWFHFTKSPKYFAAMDEIREPQTVGHIQQQLSTQRKVGRRALTYAGGDKQGLHDYINPLGKLPGSVWELETVDDCIERFVKGWAPKDRPPVILILDAEE